MEKYTYFIKKHFNNTILKIKRIFNKYFNEKNDVLVSLSVGLFITVFYAFLNFSYAYSMNVEKNISDNVIRFHVLANSDSVEDQNLKIYVKNSILEKYEEDLLKNESREDALKFFNDNMEEIEQYAKSLIIEQGFTYDVKCEIEKVKFPTKEYNDVKLPAGEYLAFRVLIGDHEGQNFWCVLYPPLCYTEESHSKEFEKAKSTLENSLSEDEFLLISEHDSASVEVKFKIVEFWNK